MSEKDKYHMAALYVESTKTNSWAYEYREPIGGCLMWGLWVGEIGDGVQRYKFPVIK